MVTQLVLDLYPESPPRLAQFIRWGNEAVVSHLEQCLRQLPSVPTYLWGGVGGGKTHLLSAMYHELNAQGLAVGWLTPQSPIDMEFDPLWDVMIWDDYHRFQPDLQAQAFRWLVQAQFERSIWLLASGTMPPTDLPGRKDLQSRLASGDIFQIHMPTEALCKQVLKQAAQTWAFDLSEDVLHFILTRYPRDLTSLMTLLRRLEQVALAEKRGVSITLVKQVMASWQN